MPNPNDEPMYRTFEEFEREELRRAEAIGGSVDALFDDLFTDELEFDAASVNSSRRDDFDEEE